MSVEERKGKRKTTKVLLVGLISKKKKIDILMFLRIFDGHNP